MSMYVILEVNEVKFALTCDLVGEVFRLEPVTAIPSDVKYIAGVLQRREQVLTVIDLHRRLGLGRFAPTKDSRLVEAHVDGIPLGLQVDRVLAVDVLGRQMQEEGAGDLVDSPFIKEMAQWNGGLVFVLTPQSIINKSIMMQDPEWQAAQAEYGS